MFTFISALNIFVDCERQFICLIVFFLYTDVVSKFLLCFSLIQNTNRILSTKVPPGAITSINGMRVLSMWWVILGHCYAFQVMTGLPSKLFHIFITNKLPKIYFRRRNNSSRQQLFQYFKGEKGLSFNPGSEECQCRYERGVVFLSLRWLGHYLCSFRMV